MSFPQPYALPLRIRKTGEFYVVEDASGVTLAYVYCEEEPTRRGLVKRLSDEDTKRGRNLRVMEFSALLVDLQWISWPISSKAKCSRLPPLLKHRPLQQW